MTDGISDEGYLKEPPLKNLGFISPKPSFSDSRYYLRSCTKLSGSYPISTGIGVGRDALGLRSNGLPLKENEQFHAIGALRAVMSLALVTL